eukprot:4600782-Pyramimonas_sp.AAC.1
MSHLHVDVGGGGHEHGIRQQQVVEGVLESGQQPPRQQPVVQQTVRDAQVGVDRDVAQEGQVRGALVHHLRK